MKIKKYCLKILSLSMCLSILGISSTYAESLKSENTNNEFLIYEIENEEQSLDKKIEEINMSPNEVTKLYNYFVNQNKEMKAYTDGYDDIPDFVEYTVENGFIEDNDLARTRMSKEGYRSIFRGAAKTLKSSGFFYAGDFLENSLNDKPKPKSYSASSNLSSDIKLQAGYKDSKNAITKAIKSLSSSKTTYTRKNSFNLNKNGANKKSWDLFLALHGVSYKADAKKINSKKWTYSMTVTDYYDFKPEKYKDSPIVNTVNNYAYAAMKAGAIVPFNIKIIINDSVSI